MSGQRWLDPELRKAASVEATVVQQQGADPEQSVVLRASAGSGKTKVLVDRLLRLLLAGATLKSVIAMTFTRKAAVEIRGRLMKKVNELALLDSETLTVELAKLLGRQPRSAEISRATALPEELLADPSGLLVGTIHTFASSLLRRFADEAGLDPEVQVVEREDDLWDEALERLERETVTDEDLRNDWSLLAPQPDNVRDMLLKWRQDRTSLDRWRERVAGGDLPVTWSAMAAAMGADLLACMAKGTLLAEGVVTVADLALAAVAPAREFASSGLDLVETADDGTSTKTKLPADIEKLRAEILAIANRLASSTDPAADLEDLIDATFAKDRHAAKTFRSGSKPNKEARKEACEQAVIPLRRIVQARILMTLLETNLRLLRVGTRLIDHYEALKQRDRVLDFHDLETRARRLVQDIEIGPWIQYRMDARLDHLLVDEFQDTNRDQWDLVRPFADEFMSALTEDEQPRTVFFVGDVKQSIYGFRGARPAIFGETAAWLRQYPASCELTLPTNFRSLPAVVETIGQAFTAAPLAGLLPDGEDKTVVQKPYRDDGPGLVAIHPVDVSDINIADAHEQCAARAVDLIMSLKTQTLMGDDGQSRPVRWSDILILARGRTHLEPYERALREHSIPIVPAGRGALARSREVRDILALLRWLAFPADDTALAAVLRSPLFRISEDVLQHLLAEKPRGRSLWIELRRHEDSPLLSPIAATLYDWLVRVGLESTHDLLRRIARDISALDSYELALGEQARFNLQRLYDMALDHDRSAFPSLRGLIQFIKRAAVAKDQEEATLPETDLGRVRLMTIHGAKGLEAPFVLLVDGEHKIEAKISQTALQHPSHDGPVIVGLNKMNRSPYFGLQDDAVVTAYKTNSQSSRREEANLLYVAMTRAQNEFHVLSARSGASSAESYREWLATSLGRDEDDVVLVEGSGTADASPPSSADRYRIWEPTGTGPRIKVTSPTTDTTPPVPSGDDHSESSTNSSEQRSATDRGTLIHLWLQRATEQGDMPPGSGEEWDEARNVFTNPSHTWLFAPKNDVVAGCEVPLLHRLEGRSPETRVQGVIDRLLIGPDEIVIVDYKSNRITQDQLDETVEHYRPQMEAYRRALEVVHPGRTIRTLLLFTHLQSKDGAGLLVPVA